MKAIKKTGYSSKYKKAYTLGYPSMFEIDNDLGGALFERLYDDTLTNTLDYTSWDELIEAHGFEGMGEAEAYVSEYIKESDFFVEIDREYTLVNEYEYDGNVDECDIYELSTEEIYEEVNDPEATIKGTLIDLYYWRYKNDRRFDIYDFYRAIDKDRAYLDCEYEMALNIHDYGIEWEIH